MRVAVFITDADIGTMRSGVKATGWARHRHCGDRQLPPQGSLNIKWKG